MTEQLGKIEKLEVGHFKRGKKLYLVPLVYSSEDDPEEYREKCARYWRQVAEHLSNLASKIGPVCRVYHESVFQSGEDGMKAMQKLNPSSYQIAKAHCDNGATFEAIEEKELLEEVIDWQRCLMLGLTSSKVATRVSESYTEAVKRRNELMAKKISETLKDEEAGLLFIREEHSVQFPKDIEVFTVFPPALDEIHRWVRDQVRLEMERFAKKGKQESKRQVAEGDEGTSEEAKGSPDNSPVRGVS